MTDTVHLGLPFIEGSQAQKHVTHNEALRILDSVVHIGVLDDALGAPPPSPSEGDRYLVPDGATGAWAGQVDALAVFEDGVWRFFTPDPGWCAWSAASSALLVYDGATWSPVADGGGGGGPFTGSVAQLGINATATAPNLLTLASNAALFKAITAADGGSGDMRLQISKEGSANIASVIFSDALSGRAEFGLVGSDQFKLKVSDDGLTFTEAMTFDQVSGNATFARGLFLTGIIAPAQITADQNDYNPAGLGAASVVNLSSDATRSLSGLAGGAEGRVVSLLNTGSQIVTLLNESASSTAANRFALGGDVAVGAKQAVWLRYDGTASRWHALAQPAGASREVLTANRTYYVRTDGTDGNSGLANTSGGAFATPQAALNAAAKIDFNGFVVTIQMGDGTYTGYISIPAMVGQASVGSLLIQGNVTTPSNVVLTQAGSYQSTITVPQRAAVTLSAFRVSATNNGYGFRNSGGLISYSNIDFGACGGQHIAAEGGYTLQTGNVTISGGGEAHWNAGSGSIIKSQGRTITASTSVSFSTGFATADAAGSIVSSGNTFSGTYTGPRYRGTTNGVIITNGGGANYFPGSSAGSLLTGAQYQ